MTMPVEDLLLRLALAVVLGGLIGLEREFRHKPAGLRTNMLIALGSAVFSIVSLEIGGADGSSDRIAAQIVSGIGFLGAGAILQRGTDVQGLTTAATIWVNAAIGMAAGIGAFRLAAGAAAFALVVLTVLSFVDRLVERRHDSSDR